MDEAPAVFRIEVTGPELPSQAGLYGAGDAHCHSAPYGGRLESQYACPSIGVVVAGQFDYHSPTGMAEARPGTLLFGNAGEEFTYRYVDSRDVRRSVVALDGGLLAEVADDCGCEAAAFPVSGLAAGRATAPLYAAVRRLVSAERPNEEAVVRLAAAALRPGRRLRPISAAERSRVRDVASLIDAEYAEPMSLGEMAGLASLIRYHFIRAFRSVTGETPRQYLIGARLRAAADRLLDTRETVTEIAFGVGYNDVSHFNATFRAAFGASPRSFRRAA
jgi:AraC family transcriptional regulator